MKKLLIFDTEDGSALTQKYINMLPNIKISGLSADGKSLTNAHPHGRMCGYLAGLPLTYYPSSWEIIFARIFDEQAHFIKDAEKFMIETIKTVKPNIISASIGQWDQDSDIGDMFGMAYWSKFSEEIGELKKLINFLDFWAAGNEDNNDSDEDIDYPQCLQKHSHIIGATHKTGVPAIFSGDGELLECVMWGVNRPLNNNGIWETGSGTSFTCPAAAGLCAYHNFKTDEDWINFVIDKASIPTNWTRGKKSKKFGYGNMEEEYQKIVRHIHPNISILNENTTHWFNFKQVPQQLESK